MIICCLFHKMQKFYIYFIEVIVLNKFKGSGVALVTPFDKDNRINYPKLYELIDWHVNSGTDYLVICGTTGEAATLSFDEKCELISKSISYSKGKIPIVCGTGSNNTTDAIKLSKFANIEGSDALLIVSPYYNKGNEDGIYKHYAKIAEEVFPTPVILYNVPSRTGVDMSVNLILSLAKIPNIVAIKEASPSIEKIAKLIAGIKKDNLDFNVICGNDMLTIPALSLGAIGTISVVANIIPDKMHEICSGNTDIFYSYFDLIESLSLDINPIMIKEALNYIGMDVGSLRLPLSKTSDPNYNKLCKIIDRDIK